VSTAVPPLPKFSVSPWTANEEAAGRANYEAFSKTTEAWMPYPADWDGQAAVVKQAWINGAKAARKVSA
jgi:hypothetical protein